MQEKYRPSHADYTYDAKYGVRDWRGGGRTSARETAGRVAAGAIARKLLATRYRRRDRRLGLEGRRARRRVRRRDASRASRSTLTPIRCPDPATAERMIAAVEAARKDGNSLGGVVTCAVRGCPPGWGEPVFDRLEADLAKAMLSLPASKGFEIGSGFAGHRPDAAREHNDEFYMDGDRVRTRTNRSGGVQGGITNGETIYFRVAFKPTATIMREQHTVDVAPRGHDHHRAAAATTRACCPRAVPDGRGDGRAGARRPRAPPPGGRW